MVNNNNFEGSLYLIAYHSSLSELCIYRNKFQGVAVISRETINNVKVALFGSRIERVVNENGGDILSVLL